MKYIVKHKLKSTENLKLLLLFLFFFCMTVHKRNSKLFYCSFFLYTVREQWCHDKNVVWNVHCIHKFHFFFFRVELTGKRARTHARAQSHPHSLQSPTHSDAYSITSQKTRKHYQDAIDWMWPDRGGKYLHGKTNEHFFSLTRAETCYSV